KELLEPSDGRSLCAPSSRIVNGASVFFCPAPRTTQNINLGSPPSDRRCKNWAGPRAATYRSTSTGPPIPPRFADRRRNWWRSRRTSSWQLVPISSELTQVTHTVPIVFPIIADPVAGGFVESLARPGGNATGFMLFEYSISGKWLELLKQIAPGVTRVAVLGDPDIPTGPAQFGVIQAVAPSLRVEVSAFNKREANEIERIITTFA